MCFVKYHVSEDKSSIVESSGGVQTLCNVSVYHEPTWHFDAKFVDGQRNVRANLQKSFGHGHFLEMKNSVYHCPYDLIDNRVNAIYIVYIIRKYDSTGTEHNYLFSCGFDRYVESVEMYNYYKSIPFGLIAAWMTYLCDKYKISKRAEADGSTII